MTRWIGKLLGIEDLESIEAWDFAFSAPWAEGRPALVLFACIGLAVLGVVFYLRFQRGAEGRGRLTLTIMRAAMLAALIAVLAEPVIALTIIERPRPLLPIVIDGTESMAFKDKLPPDDYNSLAATLKDAQGRPLLDLHDASRLDLVRAVINNPHHPVLNELAESYRLRIYLMDQREELRELAMSADAGAGGAADEPRPARPDDPSDDAAGELDPDHVASQLTSHGRVTDIEAALKDLYRRHRRKLGAVIVLSDFAHNTRGDAVKVAESRDARLYTVGVGPREVVNLKVAGIKSDLIMLKDNQTSVRIDFEQSGLSGRTVRVQLMARRLGSFAGQTQSRPVPVAAPKTVTLGGADFAEFTFTPTVAGEHKLLVEVEPFEDEVLVEDNAAERDVTVFDKSMSMLFVEYEPTWEWRFIKEVFHRHRLIGREGFRTFLRSADFKVRRTNDLFLETLVRPRHEFFANDVIFLSDIPPEILSDHFQEMLREYVHDFGGGLVVIAGPRFGPASLAGTKIADMLPVVLDPNARTRVGEFSLQFTPAAAHVEFMNLGEGDDGAAENRRAWDNMGKLPWYQPVLRADPRAQVLAVHPTDRCVDDKPQPIIAVGQYGRGQVVYLGFNETWRLRRRYDEKYYSRFWSQMMSRLGLGRNLGAQKRFQVDVDRRSKTYEVGEKVRVIIEAYDENFKTLAADQLEARHITEEGGVGGGSATIAFTVGRREGDFYEAIVPVEARGKHRILVRDPVTGEEREVDFIAAPQSLEQRRPDRDYKLQQDLAAVTGGKAYELHQLYDLADELRIEPPPERTERKFGLWNTWAVFAIVLFLMLGEWLTRKLFNMR